MGGALRGLFAAIGALSIAALILAAPQSVADDVSRSEYVDALESICKEGTQKNRDALKGVKGQIENGQLKPASRRFFRAAAVFRVQLRRLAEVPQPSPDAARLTQWFSALQAEVRLLSKIARSLQAEEKGKVPHYAEQLNKGAKRANNLVLGFGFAYCTLDPGRLL